MWGGDVQSLAIYAPGTNLSVYQKQTHKIRSVCMLYCQFSESFHSKCADQVLPNIIIWFPEYRACTRWESMCNYVNSRALNVYLSLIICHSSRSSKLCSHVLSYRLWAWRHCQSNDRKVVWSPRTLEHNANVNLFGNATEWHQMCVTATFTQNTLLWTRNIVHWHTLKGQPHRAWAQPVCGWPFR